MLKTRNIFLLSAAVFAFLFWVWASLGYPLEITICEPNGGADKCGTHYVPVGIVRWILFQLERYGVLLTAIFTGFIAWFTWTLRQSTEKMWRLGKQQMRLTRALSLKQDLRTQETIRLARDEFNSSHRPEIRFKHLWLTSDISQAVPITVKIVCVNAGTANATPAQIGVRCHVVGNEYLLPADPNIAHALNFDGITLLCGRNWTIPSIDPADSLNTGRILAPHEWAAIQRGDAKLYCVGWVSYLDAAERMRITGFCRVLEAPDAQTVLTPNNGRFRVCKHSDYEYQD